MPTSIKFGNGYYLDSSGVTVNNSGKTLATYLDGLVVTQGYTVAVTDPVPPVGSGYRDAIFNCVKSGYTFLGVVGWSIVASGGSSSIVPVHVDTTNANSVVVRLASTSAIGVAPTTVTIKALYIKTL